MNDTLMCHSLSASTLKNAMQFSHNSVQGHHHSSFGVERFADKGVLRWSMTVGCLIDPNGVASRYNAKAVLKRPILGCGILIGEHPTLIISDLHLPYQHKDALDFLWALAQRYDVQRVLNVGDLYDHHRGSYHESEPDALSEEQEYYAARRDAHVLQEMFPEMVITAGNHDAIPQRKLKTVGLPTSMVADYNALYDTEDTWIWTDHYWFDSKKGFPLTVPMVLTKRGRWDKVLP